MSLALTSPATARRPSFDRLLMFWVPVIVLAVLVIRNDARMAYAQSANGAAVEAADLAENAGTGTRERQLLFLALGATGGMLLWRDQRTNRRPIYWPIMLLLGLLFAYGCCSVVWSDSPFLTVKRMIVLGCLALGAIGIGKVWSTRDFCLALIGWTLLFVLISVAAELANGVFLRGGDYRFSGVFHPNKQVFFCAFLFLCSSCMYQSERKRIYLAIAIFALIAVILTKSRTGTAACLLAGAWLWWSYLPRNWIVNVAVAGSILFSIGLIGLGASGEEVSLLSAARMGREDELSDPTKLTGRLPIWTETLSAFINQPLLGFGYGAFWSPERIRYFESQNGWAFSHAHSIYIESAVNWGLLGVFIMLMIVVATVRRAKYLLRTHERMAGRWMIALLILAAIAGLAESAFVADGFEAIVLCASIGLVACHGPVPPARGTR
ncbi:O-Antigen ligase [Rosistilla oblonga]|uniref:O-antigen ligase family protein n=1 Tax=Rosistilla oblonga TaxID=2527990 RepID=UPI00118D06AD|nr:O-antigen ligase family protein [Rosistilla oblonga]QDV11628.1 O-Antigen ligase [Rosistilla oblonga]